MFKKKQGCFVWFCWRELPPLCVTRNWKTFVSWPLFESVLLPAVLGTISGISVRGDVIQGFESVVENRTKECAYQSRSILFNLNKLCFCCWKFYIYEQKWTFVMAFDIWIFILNQFHVELRLRKRWYKCLFYRKCFKAAVGNLSDLRDHPWSTDHQLATSALRDIVI